MQPLTGMWYAFDSEMHVPTLVGHIQVHGIDFINLRRCTCSHLNTVWQTQATQWVMRQGNVTNVAGRIFALESVGVWQALQANLREQEPADETAVVGTT